MFSDGEADQYTGVISPGRSITTNCWVQEARETLDAPCLDINSDADIEKEVCFDPNETAPELAPHITFDSDFYLTTRDGEETIRGSMHIVSEYPTDARIKEAYLRPTQRLERKIDVVIYPGSPTLRTGDSWYLDCRDFHKHPDSCWSLLEHELCVVFAPTGLTTETEVCRMIEISDRR